MAGGYNPKQNASWHVMFVDRDGTEHQIMRPMIEQLSIYESIYNNCMFGNLMMVSDGGFCEEYDLVGSGEEKLIINIENENASPGANTNNLEKEFIINSVSNVQRSMNGDGKYKFTIGFVSPFLVKNNKTRISRSFNAMTSSEIVNFVGLDVLEFGIDLDYTELLTNTDSKHTKNITVPNWKPFSLFNFLAKNTVSIEGNSNYIFFENNEGFHFTTIEDLKKESPIRMIKVSELQEESLADGVGASATMKTVGNNAEKFSELERFDIAKNTAKGMYGGRVTTHNILTKTYETYDAVNDPLGSILGDVGFGDVYKKEQIPKSHLGHMSSNYIYDIHDKGDYSHYAVRDMKMCELRSNSIKFDVAGDTNIFAGNVIEVLIPSLTGDSNETDKYMSGLYIITAIHHKLNIEEYVMTMECSKDGFDYEV